ncbi:MAG: ribonuclease HI [Bacteroidia bacterium]|nr:ribonuclease HI [Bacteroidia bacterium]
MNQKLINIYTDGSCHTQLNIGGWAAIIFFENKKTIIKGKEFNTTHNRMELLAVIKAIEFAETNYKNFSIKIFTDSQYVFRIPERMEKLKINKFITKKGNQLNNNDLLQILITQIENHSIEFVKVKAHQKTESENSNYNSEVDKLAREIVRQALI